VKRKRRRQSRADIPVFKSHAEASKWWYAHRNDEFVPIKLTPVEVRRFFGKFSAEIEVPKEK
jgi:hypothetical protein